MTDDERPDLTAEQIRVLGALIEKERTTPDQYPLSTNALVAACNQKNNRDPVVAYDARLVDTTMLSLREGGLARTVRPTGNRAHKHRHVLDEAWHLDDGQLAVLAVLMLRGPQSAGELRTRTERYIDGADTATIEAILSELAGLDEPLAVNIGRDAGQSQDRWAHLAGGLGSTGPVRDPGGHEPRSAAPTTSDAPAAVPPPGPSIPMSSRDDLERLVERVRDLEQRLERIETALGPL